MKWYPPPELRYRVPVLRWLCRIYHEAAEGPQEARGSTRWCSQARQEAEVIRVVLYSRGFLRHVKMYQALVSYNIIMLTAPQLFMICVSYLMLEWCYYQLSEECFVTRLGKNIFRRTKKHWKICDFGGKCHKKYFRKSGIFLESGIFFQLKTYFGNAVLRETRNQLHPA